ncbi:MAG: A/G-specific adenine glycosylase [Candidatus Nitrotoga sp.]
MSDFATQIIHWHHQHGRHHLPWQGADAYRVWLSEIMLQQTQVATVIPYYQRFVDRFPNLSDIAQASEEEVLEYWSGLGYYSRGRNLHRAAQQIMQQHDGIFPNLYSDILALPGIGRSTAAAISAFAFQQRQAILDGNVKRVLARFCAIEGYAGDKKIEAKLWQQAERLLPKNEITTYTQGLMDLGALICTRSKPQCVYCPVQKNCAAYQQQRVASLPTPRLRKMLPEKSSAMILLISDNQTLLEKRAGSGIWGGLWSFPEIQGCFPEIEQSQHVDAYCTRYLGLEGKQSYVSLPMFTHSFTHFKLHITPLLLHLPGKPKQMSELGKLWINLEDALGAAIPTPVRKILKSVQMLE